MLYLQQPEDTPAGDNDAPMVETDPPASAFQLQPSDSIQSMRHSKGSTTSTTKIEASGKRTKIAADAPLEGQDHVAPPGVDDTLGLFDPETFAL